jgi:hypothetical protein
MNGLMTRHALENTHKLLNQSQEMYVLSQKVIRRLYNGLESIVTESSDDYSKELAGKAMKEAMELYNE